MTSYLKVTANPGTDSMALEQIINVPSRKIGGWKEGGSEGGGRRKGGWVKWGEPGCWAGGVEGGERVGGGQMGRRESSFGGGQRQVLSGEGEWRCQGISGVASRKHHTPTLHPYLHTVQSMLTADRQGIPITALQPYRRQRHQNASGRRRGAKPDVCRSGDGGPAQPSPAAAVCAGPAADAAWGVVGAAGLRAQHHTQ